MFEYLSINHKTFRAVANEEFLELEHRRAWVVFCSYCAGENGCPNTPKAIAKAAMLPLEQAAAFIAQIQELVEERDGLIAPLEVWRAIDRATQRRQKDAENGKRGGRPPKNPTVSNENPRVSQENPTVSNENPRVSQENPNETLQGEGESEVNCEGESEVKGVARARAHDPPSIPSLSRQSSLPATEAAQHLDDCIALLVAEFRVPMPGNERYYRNAAQTVLAFFAIETAADQVRAFRKAKPNVVLNHFDKDFATWGSQQEKHNGINTRSTGQHSAGSSGQRFGRNGSPGL